MTPRYMALATGKIELPSTVTGKFREKSFGGHTGGGEKGMELALVWDVMNFMCLVALRWRCQVGSWFHESILV